MSFCLSFSLCRLSSQTFSSRQASLFFERGGFFKRWARYVVGLAHRDKTIAARLSCSLFSIFLIAKYMVWITCTSKFFPMPNLAYPQFLVVLLFFRAFCGIRHLEGWLGGGVAVGSSIILPCQLIYTTEWQQAVLPEALVERVEELDLVGDFFLWVQYGLLLKIIFSLDFISFNIYLKQNLYLNIYQYLS